MVWPKLFHWRKLQSQRRAPHQKPAKVSCGEEAGKIVESETNVKALKTYGCDLVGPVGKLDHHVLGRDDEVREVISILSRETEKNPLLIGEPGVGKIDVVKGLAEMIFKGDVPNNLKNVQVTALDMVSLNEFEGKLKEVLKEVQEAQRKVILFIDNIHLVVGAGQTQWSTDEAALLKHMIATGQLWCIGGTTPEGNKKYLEKDDVLEKNFEEVLIAELSVPATMSILHGVKESYERRHGVRILDLALVVAVKLSSRYITGHEGLPNKAINLVNEACVNVKAQFESILKEIYNLKRRLTQVEIELQYSNKEKDKASRGRLVEIRKKLDDLKDKFLNPKKKERRDENRRLEKRRGKLLLEAEKNKIARAINLESMYIESGKNVRTVGPYEIAKLVSRWSGIPVTKLLGTFDDKKRLCGLADRLHQRVVGQDEAINDVAKAVWRSRASLGRLDQQIASILFVGTDAVRKTELVEALAEELFYDQKFFITIYMDGYSRDAIDLADVLKRNNYGIVLFEGVEKSHEAMFNSLFRMLEDGWLSDLDTVLILNCNFEAWFSRKTILKVTHPFESELIDRLDAIVVFDAE